MLELKEAIKKSFYYIDEMYENQELPNKLLEEIEYDESKDIWKVVIGFDTNKQITTQIKTPLNIFTGEFPTEKKTERKYKQLQLKGEDGKLLKMIDQML